mgnify:CR=1 FL=1
MPGVVGTSQTDKHTYAWKAGTEPIHSKLLQTLHVCLILPHGEYIREQRHVPVSKRNARIRGKQMQGNEADMAAAAAGIGIILVLFFCFVVFLIAAIGIASYWQIFSKAGQPGWAALIPIYNLYILLQIVGRPGIWLLFMCIPFVNLVFAILLMLDLAKSFGRSPAFGVGLILLGVIFFPILAFGDSSYQGPSVAN